MKEKDEGDTTMATDDDDDDDDHEGLLNILKSIQLGHIVDADTIKSTDGKTTSPECLCRHQAQLLCVSKLYKSITLVELSNIVKVSEREAERKGIEMISQGKFKGVFTKKLDC